MPLGQDGDPFGQSGCCDVRDIFDQFLTFDTTNIEDSIFIDAPESTVLVRPINGVDSAGTSSEEWGAEARHSNQHSQLSRGEPGDPHNAASPQDALRGKTLHSHESGRAVGPEDDLLSLERVSLDSPQIASPPSSPNLLIIKPSRGRRQFQERISKNSKNYSDCPASRKSSPIRKATCPPKMMHRSTYSEQNLHDWERLARDAQKFNFGFQNPDIPLSPPPSARVSDSPDHANNIMQTTRQHDTTFTWDHPFQQQQFLARAHADMNSPLTTPPSDQITFSQSNIQAADHSILYQQPHRTHASTTWAQTPLDSDFAFNSSAPYVNDPEQEPIWWAHAATIPLAEPAPAAYHRLNIQQDTKSLAVNLQAELAYNASELALSPSSIPSGLMIQIPQSPSHHQSFIVDPSPMGQEQQGYFAPVASALRPVASQPQSQSQQIQPPRYPTTNTATATTQPQASYAQPKSHAPTSTTTESSSSPSPRTRASSFHVNKRRTTSRKVHAGSEHHHSSRSTSTVRASKSRTATTAPAVPTMADFVNFTPSDSMKILTGVAPSGSSKTKARREKEAMLEKRRLSQAAVRAVQRAGGSIESLEGFVGEEGLEGLFVSPT